jgi:drug/metabolite transporter (DMT)-like permease
MKRHFLHLKNSGVGYILLVSLFFGLMPAVTQLSFKTGLSVETMLAGRYFITLVITWVYIYTQKTDFRIEKRQFYFLMLIGFTYAGVAVFINQAYQYLPGSIASMLVFTYVSITVVVAVLIKREKANRIKGFCVLLSLIGIVLISWAPDGGSQLSLLGLISVFLAAFFYAMYALLLGGKRIKHLDDIVIVGYVLIAPTLFNIGRCLVSDKPLIPASFPQLLYILGLAVFCTFLTQLFFCKAVKLIGSSNSAIINTIEPVIAYFAGMFLMGDQLTLKAIIGGVLVLSSVILLNVSNSKSAPISANSDRIK